MKVLGRKLTGNIGRSHHVQLWRETEDIIWSAGTGFSVAPSMRGQGLGEAEFYTAKPLGMMLGAVSALSFNAVYTGTQQLNGCLAKPMPLVLFPAHIYMGNLIRIPKNAKDFKKVNTLQCRRCVPKSVLKYGRTSHFSDSRGYMNDSIQ